MSSEIIISAKNIEMGKRLQNLRGKESQTSVAAKVGITQGMLSRYERGLAEPDSDNLVKLARLYGVQADWLLHGESDEIKFMPRLDKTRSLDKSWPLGKNNPEDADDPAIHEIIKELLRLPDVERWEMAAKIKRTVADRLASIAAPPGE